MLIRRPFAVAGATALATLLAAASASAHDIEVCASGCDATSLQQAVGLSHAGDTISIQAGEYTDAGAFTIPHDLTIAGAGRDATVLRPGFDLGNSNHAWITVADGATIELSDATLDGQGRKIGIALRFVGSGSGSIDRAGFRNISFAHPHLGIAVATNKGGALDPASGDLDVANSRFENVQRVGVLYKGGVTGTFRDNVYVGKGEGDHIDYALDISAGANVEVIGNRISGNRGVAATDGSTSAAILLSTFYGAGTRATITRNTLVDNTTAVGVGYNDADTSAVTLRGNRIVGNDYGVSASGPSVAIDADGNWWGCNGGPGASGCDGVVGLDAPTRWTVLRASADRPTIGVFDATAVRADFTRDNAGEPIAGGGVPEGTEVAFATDAWSVQPSAAVSGGTAAAMLSSNDAPGVATVTATLDGASASTSVTVPYPPAPTPEPDPAPQPQPDPQPQPGEPSQDPPTPAPGQLRREAAEELGGRVARDRSLDLDDAVVFTPRGGASSDTPRVTNRAVRFDRAGLREGEPQRLLAVGCQATTCRVSVRAVATIATRDGSQRRVALRSVSLDLASGEVDVLALDLPRSVRQAILRGDRVTLRLTITVRTASGATTTATKTYRLSAPRR